MRRLIQAGLLVAGASYAASACVSESATAVVGSRQCDGGCTGGRASASGGRAGNAGTGGATGRDAGEAGAGGGGGTGGNGGASSGGADTLDAGASGGATAVDYSLSVDAPVDGATVRGKVTVRGRATVYQNVEVWDATHQMPPLAEVVPAADGSFSLTVDASVLTNGPTTWTVWAWNSPPGQPFDHSERVTLALTIAGGLAPTDSSVPPTETVGTGDPSKPAKGPAPTETTKIGGAPFVLVKNWDFGTDGTITDVASLVSEFQFHDPFGSIANGTNYGAVIVAPDAATAVVAKNLGLPDDMQPVEDPAHPVREWTASSLKTYVRPLTTSQTTCTVSSHDAGSGSFVAKWKLASGGVLLGKDVLWETRVRMPTPLAAYFYSIWASASQWNQGPEMDVLQSFGTPNIYPPPTAFHSNSLGGNDDVDYTTWPPALDGVGVPANGRDLRDYHVVSWLYSKDDSYAVYFDGVVVQKGSLHWTLGGAPGAAALDVDFLFDLGWGSTKVADASISLPASTFPLTYELDYSRVYLR
ncbi:MAG TPA: hypothetical protein VH062_07990 [Polyangiaceae bacterium]|jgi:hypothetical protein|nr:hypothetical protein [Polyangiaceae bacterium]